MGRLRESFSDHGGGLYDILFAAADTSAPAARVRLHPWCDSYPFLATTDNDSSLDGYALLKNVLSGYINWQIHFHDWSLTQLDLPTCFDNCIVPRTIVCLVVIAIDSLSSIVYLSIATVVKLHFAASETEI